MTTAKSKQRSIPNKTKKFKCVDVQLRFWKDCSVSRTLLLFTGTPVWSPVPLSRGATRTVTLSSENHTLFRSLCALLCTHMMYILTNKHLYTQIEFKGKQ